MHLLKKGTLTVLFFLTVFSVYGQTKIGYTNIELVLSYMPEARKMEQDLTTFQKKLQEQYDVKLKYAQSKLEEYQQQEANLAPDQKKTKEAELMKLQEEIKKFEEDSQNNLVTKREELLGPITERLQKAIEDVASELGFTYILNQTNSSGVSTILHGPKENDVTEAIMKKLGITVPAGGGSGSTTGGSGTEPGK